MHLAWRPVAVKASFPRALNLKPGSSLSSLSLGPHFQDEDYIRVRVRLIGAKFPVGPSWSCVEISPRSFFFFFPWRHLLDPARFLLGFPIRFLQVPTRDGWFRPVFRLGLNGELIGRACPHRSQLSVTERAL